MFNMRKLLAMALAVVMVLSLATTAFAEGTGNYTITIDNDAKGHTYEAYQIFKGDLSNAAGNDAADNTNAVLSNIEWGAGITGEGQKALKDMFGLSDDATAADVAAKLKGENVKEFAALAGQHLVVSTAKKSEEQGDAYVISGLEAGYYLVKDQNDSLDNKHDAYTSFIIEVVENSTVVPKSGIPSVDKQVQDEVADKDAESKDTEGWGETADHAINESFQFKLIATLPADTDFAAYETYKVVFTDTMSDGITFEKIVSVTVDGVTISDYDCTAEANQKGGHWTLTIDDIKAVNDVNLIDGAVVEVIYKAHLNENAVVGNEDDNKNTVYLQYSNNPNVGGGEDLGKTNEDTVWVFTYKVDSTKYKDKVDNGNKLDGAGFTLYYSADGSKKGDPVMLVFDETNNVYRPAPAGETEGVVTEMVSANGGVFNVVGLDVGTYIMKETTVPAGYNKCDDIVIVITAKHSETADTTANTIIEMTIDGAVANTNEVINKAGTTLPETGGIGTTIFYVFGGLLMVAAAVLLVTKKRMSAEA